ncbi:MAG: killer suppression protein HigA [Acidobacteria bacterium]|nr:killer suppression protein HigA [Acidobacteriota bacterium]
MEILFASTKLRELCEQQKKMQKEMGAACARKLRTRLADLAAATNVSELAAGEPHPLKSDRAGQIALKLHGGDRLVFESANDPTPKTQDDAIDWANVTIVRIVFIGDYHD